MHLDKKLPRHEKPKHEKMAIDVNAFGARMNSCTRKNCCRSKKFAAYDYNAICKFFTVSQIFHLLAYFIAVSRFFCKAIWDGLAHQYWGR